MIDNSSVALQCYSIDVGVGSSGCFIFQNMDFIMTNRRKSIFGHLRVSAPTTLRLSDISIPPNIGSFFFLRGIHADGDHF